MNSTTSNIITTHNKQINYQFKILYAFGMFLVVSNHCGNGAFSLFYEFFPAYSFHMGLFVFCSGYFYKENAEQSVIKYILKKVSSLLLPLYLWNCVYALIAQLLTLRGFTMGAGVSIDQLLFLPLYNGHQFAYNLASWFVFPLFTVEVFNILFRKLLFPFKVIVKEIVYITSALCFGMFGIYLSNIGLNHEWGLIITKMLTFLPFYCGGYFYRCVLEKRDTLPNIIYFGIVVFTELAIIIHNGGTMSWEPAWSKYTEFNAMPFVIGFLGIAFWLRIARILEPVIGKSMTIKLISDNTFSIMINHFLGFMLVKSLFAFFFMHSNNLFSDFDWNAYHTDIWYYYLPKELKQSRLLYIVVAIAFSIIVQKIIDLSKSKLNTSYNSKSLLAKKVAYVLAIVFATVIPATLIAKNVQASGGIIVPKCDAYTLGNELFFDKENSNVDKYIKTGFSVHDDRCQWTDDYEAIMSFTLNNYNSNTDLKLLFSCGVYGNQQTISIYVNNNFIENMTIEGDNTYTISIPKKVVENNCIELKFEIPGASSPLRNGEGNDDRLLGLSMRNMVILSNN